MAFDWRRWFGLDVSMQRFARLLAQEFAKHGSVGWTYHADNGTLAHTGGAVVNLGNLYLEYKNAPRAQRAGILAKHGNFARLQNQSVPKLWELAAKGIHAVLRSRWDMVPLAIRARGDESKALPDLVAWPVAEDLVIRLAYDWGTHITPVDREIFDAWGQSLEAVRQRAVQNLAALPDVKWNALGDGLFELESPGSYAESLFQVDKIVDRLPFKDHIACVPSNRGVLLACDRERPDRLGAMLELAIGHQQNAPWPLSGIVLTRDGGRWVRFVPQDAPAAMRAGDLFRINLASHYCGQKEALEARNESQGTDVFVATYGLFRRPRDNGAIMSWCSWADGVHAVLPQTDFIAFGKPDDKDFAPLLVAWDAALARMGERMRRTPEDPPRYEVEGKFSDAEWSALAAASMR